MTDEELQAALDSGDPDLIEQAIAQYEGSPDVADPESSAGKLTEEENGAVTAADENAEPSGVTSKNGQHIIPYEVLEQERQANALLRQQLEERDREIQAANNLAASHQATTEKLALLQQQLEKEGIEPAQLPSELKITAEELEQLTEYGDVGDVTRKLGHKLLAMTALVEKLQQQSAVAAAPAEQQQSDDSPASIVNKAIDQVDGLRAILDNPDLSPEALAVDKALQKDPAWNTKPLESRFAEVMRRMAPKVVASERSKQNKKELSTDIDPPYSLSGIPGATSDVIAPLAQQFEGMTEAQIQARMSNLSDAEQDKLLQALGL